MVTIKMDEPVWLEARGHLNSGPEEAGFFLANWSEGDRTFSVTAWRPMHNQTIGTGDQLHVSLSDDTRTSVIKWASAEGACLIEAHSHGAWSPATFSRFDIQGLAEWVPHLWWRLQRRPYAALVTTLQDFDGIAWVVAADHAEQVSTVMAGGVHRATGATLARWGRPHG